MRRSAVRFRYAPLPLPGRKRLIFKGLRFRAVLRRFGTAFPGEILGIVSADIDRWLRGLDVSNSSRNSMLVFVKVFFSFARERNYLPADQPTAAEQVKRLKQGPSTAALFTPDEMEKLLHAAPMHLVPFLVFGAFAGIRSVEITRLDWSAVDLERRIITIHAGVAKTRSRRVIPIPDNLAAWLEPFPNSGRVIPSGEKGWTHRPVGLVNCRQSRVIVPSSWAVNGGMDATRCWICAIISGSLSPITSMRDCTSAELDSKSSAALVPMVAMRSAGVTPPFVDQSRSKLVFQAWNKLSAMRRGAWDRTEISWRRRTEAGTTGAWGLVSRLMMVVGVDQEKAVMMPPDTVMEVAEEDLGGGPLALLVDLDGVSRLRV